MNHHCANCTATVSPNTGRQFGTAWLDDWCLGTLATRGYLVGITGGGGNARTPLTFQRDGHLVTYLAQQKLLAALLAARNTLPARPSLAGSAARLRTPSAEADE